MKNDPYALCPCGSGNKLKWCVCKNSLPQLEQAITMIRNNQQDSSLALLDRLINDESHPLPFRIYATTVKSQALDVFGRHEDAFKLAEETTKKYADSGIAYEVFGDFFFSRQGYADALDIYEEALARFAPAATEQICRTLLKLGTCHNFQGRPLAAWAMWRQALRINPAFKPAAESIEEFIHQNRLLPNQARHGLSLKSADEFTMFDEEVGERWEKATQDGDQLHIDDLVMGFADLTAKAPTNASAWYNLGLACAWGGLNARAIEAFTKYVELEKDPDAAADAWDLAEVLRLGAGAEDLSDTRLYAAQYEITDPQSFSDRLQQSKYVVVVSAGEGERSLHWMDKEVSPPDSNIPILGGPPKQLAQFNMYGPVLELVSVTAENLAHARRTFEQTIGDSVRFDSVVERPGNPSTLDSEPFLVFDPQKISPEEKNARILESIRSYFEETWIHRPLRSLDGLSPIDAAQSSTLRKRLEGVIRFRERNFARYEAPYNFDRLRNKLGMKISGAGLSEEKDSTKPSENVDLRAYSASQLAALDAKSLNDADLVIAYKTALSLDAPQTTSNFAAEIVKRPTIADHIDVNSIFRRAINERFSAKKYDEIESLIAEARGYDERHYQSKEAAQYDLLAAKLALQQGRKDEAIDAIKQIPTKYPNRLDVAATAVEQLLSAGAYGAAKEIAETGLSQAEQERNGDFQGRFKDYLREAAARAK